jgi:hypothetical protein
MLEQVEHEAWRLEPRSSGRHRPGPWRALDLVDKLIIFVFLSLSVISLLLPFAGRATLSRLSVLPVNWMVNHGGSWVLGIGLLVLLLVFVFVRRLQIINDQQLWYDGGCPQCFEREMVRIPRKRSDRWYSLMMLPAFRYACRNCTWQGLRIARRYYWPEPWSQQGALAEVEVDLPPKVSGSNRQTSDWDWAPAAVTQSVAMRRNGHESGDSAYDRINQIDFGGTPTAYNDATANDADGIVDEDR